MRADIITAAMVGIGAWGGLLSNARGEETAAALLAEARAVLAEGRPEEALELAGKAVEEEPDGRAAYRFRAELLERMDEHERAIADYDKLIELDPDQAELYDLRGSARFKLGRIEASIADFDKAIELAPQREREHWKRGISYYYAGRYDEGRRQFEGYQTFDDNDVENAVWRYLCMAKGEGVEAARRSLLKIKDDRRLPMMQVYALFAGKCEPDDVLEAARAGDPGAEELKGRLFYAHLYLGLYFEAAGDATRAREHIATAADEHRIGHYMWHVARVHRMKVETSSRTR